MCAYTGYVEAYSEAKYAWEPSSWKELLDLTPRKRTLAFVAQTMCFKTPNTQTTHIYLTFSIWQCLS